MKASARAAVPTRTPADCAEARPAATRSRRRQTASRPPERTDARLPQTRQTSRRPPIGWSELTYRGHRGDKFGHLLFAPYVLGDFKIMATISFLSRPHGRRTRCQTCKRIPFLRDVAFSPLSGL